MIAFQTLNPILMALHVGRLVCRCHSTTKLLDFRFPYYSEDINLSHNVSLLDLRRQTNALGWSREIYLVSFMSYQDVVSYASFCRNYQKSRVSFSTKRHQNIRKDYTDPVALASARQPAVLPPTMTKTALHLLKIFLFYPDIINFIAAYCSLFYYLPLFVNQCN